MKILRIGDPHVQMHNISESYNLFDFVYETAKKHKIDRLELMGDLFHTHGIIRMDVLDFWRKTFKKLNGSWDLFVLVGNHDRQGSKEKEQEMSALDVFEPEIQKIKRTIVNKPEQSNGIAYLPYMSDQNQFLKAAQELYDQGAKKMLIAHQTFTGATYENGFYAEDGIDPALVPQEHIISGHIHKQQIIGKCHYVGTPKWDTMSDANEDKGIWLFEHNEDGSIKNKEFISTKHIVTPIIKIIINESDNEEPVLDPNARNYIELHGKTAWITKMKKKYKGKASIKARPVDRKTQSIDKEKNITLMDYLNNYFEPIDGVDKKDIDRYIKEVFNV